MQTKFTSKAQLLREITKGQEFYLEHHLQSDKSRISKVVSINSIFFTAENKNGRESWILDSGLVKLYGLRFDPDREQVHIYTKKDDNTWLTLYFNATIIAGKKGAAQVKAIPPDPTITHQAPGRQSTALQLF